MSYKVLIRLFITRVITESTFRRELNKLSTKQNTYIKLIK